MQIPRQVMAGVVLSSRNNNLSQVEAQEAARSDPTPPALYDPPQDHIRTIPMDLLPLPGRWAIMPAV